jgi:hypothetical protein
MTDTYPRAKFDGDVIDTVDLTADPEKLVRLAISKITGGMYTSSYESQIAADLDQALALMIFRRLGLTEKQQQAILRVYHRGDVTKDAQGNRYPKPLSISEFAEKIVSGHDCIMVPWQGMWLGIEKDGYTHS